MRGISVFFGLLLFVLAIGAVQVSALGGASEIMMTGVVLSTKSIYVDKNSEVKLIVSNSTSSGALKVIKSGKEKKLTPEINAQYQEILKTHNINQIGEVYNYFTEQIEANPPPALPTVLGSLGNYLKNVSVLFLRFN